MAACEASRGKHTSFSTWMPSIRAELIMDRGLNPAYICGGTGPANARLTRFLFVTPYFRGTLPQQSYCLPRHRHRIPRCDNTMPFASIWLGLGLALTSIIEKYRLTFKTCAVPGTQQFYRADGNFFGSFFVRLLARRS